MPRLPRASQGSLGSSPLPPDCLLALSPALGPRTPPNSSLPFGSSKVPSTAPLLAPSRGPASPYSDSPRSQPKRAGGVGVHISGQGSLPGKHPGLFSSHPHPAPCSQPRVQGWFFPLMSTCPLLSPGCGGERLLMFSPQKMAPPPSCLLQGLASPTSLQVGRPSKSYTQRPLGVSASPLLSSPQSLCSQLRQAG